MTDRAKPDHRSDADASEREDRPVARAAPRFPAKPISDPVDVEALHRKVMKRFPKVRAYLAR